MRWEDKTKEQIRFEYKIKQTKKVLNEKGPEQALKSLGKDITIESLENYEELPFYKKAQTLDKRYEHTYHEDYCDMLKEVIDPIKEEFNKKSLEVKLTGTIIEPNQVREIDYYGQFSNFLTKIYRTPETMVLDQQTGITQGQILDIDYITNNKGIAKILVVIEDIISEEGFFTAFKKDELLKVAKIEDIIQLADKEIIKIGKYKNTTLVVPYKMEFRT